MQINGKELGMAYTVGAHVEWQNWIVAHQNDSLAQAKLESVMIMHKWWCQQNKIPEKQRVTREEILAQPHGIFDEMLELAEAVMKADKEQSVEAKTKNPTGAEARD